MRHDSQSTRAKTGERDTDKPEPFDSGFSISAGFILIQSAALLFSSSTPFEQTHQDSLAARPEMFIAACGPMLCSPAWCLFKWDFPAIHRAFAQKHRRPWRPTVRRPCSDGELRAD